MNKRQRKKLFRKTVRWQDLIKAMYDHTGLTSLGVTPEFQNFITARHVEIAPPSLQDLQSEINRLNAKIMSAQNTDFLKLSVPKD